VESAPVITSDGTVVGIFSESALIDLVFDSVVKDHPVSQHMDPDVQVDHPDDPLSRLAELVALYSFQSLPVVKDGKFAGLGTRRDLIRHVLRTGEVLTDPLSELIPPLAPIT
jgi:CBS domain-containing protein